MDQTCIYERQLIYTFLPSLIPRLFNPQIFIACSMKTCTGNKKILGAGKARYKAIPDNMSTLDVYVSK